MMQCKSTTRFTELHFAGIPIPHIPEQTEKHRNYDVSLGRQENFMETPRLFEKWQLLKKEKMVNTSDFEY